MKFIRGAQGEWLNRRFIRRIYSMRDQASAKKTVSLVCPHRYPNRGWHAARTASKRRHIRCRGREPAHHSGDSANEHAGDLVGPGHRRFRDPELSDHRMAIIRVRPANDTGLRVSDRAGPRHG